jgi:hypothetical protein
MGSMWMPVTVERGSWYAFETVAVRMPGAFGRHRQRLG